MDKEFIPEQQLKRVLKENQTPFFLYDEKRLQQRAAEITEPFSWCSGFHGFFHVRMNRNPEILRMLARVGLGAVCSDAGEMRLAVSCGFAGTDLLYYPMRIDMEGERLCVELDAVRVIDSVYDLPPEPPQRVMLSFRPAGAPHEEVQLRQLVRQSKFGLTEQALLELADRFSIFPPKFLGLYFQTDRNDAEYQLWLAAASSVLKMGVLLQKTIHVPVNAICVGEGPGVGYRPNFAQPDFAAYADGLRKLTERILEPEGMGQTAIWCLAGKTLLAPAGAYLTTVTAVKRVGEDYTVLVDGGMAHLLRPSLFGNYHHISAVGRKAERSRVQCSVCGCISIQQDKLGDQRRLPPPRVGDVLLVHDVGAEGASVAALYCGRPRAPEILLTASGRLRDITPD